MMTNPGSPTFAPGGPGIEPRWTRGAKVAVGTAYSTSSRVWYTLDHGCITEVYFPTIDSPQIRDLQFLITDGETFFHDERRNFVAPYVARDHHRPAEKLRCGEGRSKCAVIESQPMDKHDCT